MRKRGGGWGKRKMRRFIKETLARPTVQAMDTALQYEYIYALGCIYGSPQSNFYTGRPKIELLPERR